MHDLPVVIKLNSFGVLSKLLIVKYYSIMMMIIVINNNNIWKNVQLV